MVKPDLAAAGESLAQRGSAFYRFEHFELASADGQRRYRVDLAIPRRAAPADGYPTLYLLDGNAALATLREDWLAELEAGSPPVLVMIGYVGEQRFNVPARTFDYTPGRPDGQPMQAFNGVQGGGATAFLTLLEQQIKPQVAATQPLDMRQQSLWGHSFGGLFVLNALFTQPQGFSRYIAASPSLWWQSGALLELEPGFIATAPAQVLILRGGDEGLPRTARADVDPAVVAQRAQAMAAIPADATRQLAERLARQPGLQVAYREFAGLGHGPMFAASLHPALRLAAGLPLGDADE
jgi:predicted alpha/beta superfamily hydrolase